MSKDKMDAEKLIRLVHSKPELWDQNHPLYSSRDVKFKIWQQFGHLLGVTGSAAKLKWYCLRDTFRREVKKTYHHDGTENGTSQEQYVPKWTHYRSMLFLKNTMMPKNGHNHRPQQQHTVVSGTSQSSHLLVSFLNDQKPSSDNYTGEDKFVAMDNNISDDEHDPLGASEDNSAPHPPKNRRLPLAENSNSIETSSYVSDIHSMKRTMSDDDGSPDVEPKRPDQKTLADEDYHFLQSILPSVRKIHSSRKTLFRMKVLQLIYEEEKYSKTSSSLNTAIESSFLSTNNIQVKEEIE